MKNYILKKYIFKKIVICLLFSIANIIILYLGIFPYWLLFLFTQAFVATFCNFGDVTKSNLGLIIIINPYIRLFEFISFYIKIDNYMNNVMKCLEQYQSELMYNIFAGNEEFILVNIDNFVLGRELAIIEQIIENLKNHNFNILYKRGTLFIYTNNFNIIDYIGE